MKKGVTQFRKELFQLADQALKGEQVQFLYRGVVFTVTPEIRKSKLDGLVGQPVLAPGADLDEANRKLLAEMEQSWKEDWAALE